MAPATSSLLLLHALVSFEEENAPGRPLQGPLPPPAQLRESKSRTQRLSAWLRSERGGGKELEAAARGSVEEKREYVLGT